MTLLLCAGLFVCTTQNPIRDDDGDLSIRLSLEESGTHEATYTGSDVMAILEFDDSVVCTFDNLQPEHIQFYTGSGRFRVPDEIVIGQKLRRLELPLYWTRKPGLIDSLGERYDTLFVEVGQERSNSVRVNVNNMSPSIDTIRIADTSIAVFATIYGTNSYLYDIDTLTTVPMRIVARDPDNDQIFVEWRAIVHDTLLMRSASDEKRATYRAPLFNFKDTLSVVVSDGKLGNRQISILLQRTAGLEVLSLDSLIFADTVLKGAASQYTVYQTRCDTVAVYAYFSNRLGSTVTAVGEAQNGTVESLGKSAASLSFRYSSRDARAGTYVVEDTMFQIDMIEVGLAVEGDTLTRQITIVQVPANRRPVIDSITADGSPILAGLLQAPAGDTVNIMVYAQDPDGGLDTVIHSWTTVAHQGSIVEALGNSARYVLPDSGYDTLTFMVSDTLGFVFRDTILVSADRIPVIEKITVADSIFLGSTAATDTFSFVDSAGRTIPFELTAMDADLMDALTIYWQVKSGSQAGKVFNTLTFDYTALNAAYADTALCVVSDPYGFSDSAVITISIKK